MLRALLLLVMLLLVLLLLAAAAHADGAAAAYDAAAAYAAAQLLRCTIAFLRFALGPADFDRPATLACATLLHAVIVHTG